MFNRKRLKLVIRLLILLVCLFLIGRVVQITLSRYESIGESTADIEVARFLLNTDYQSMTVKLDSIVPRDEPYEYLFSISNYDGDILTDTIISYELKIRTTTNLPLTYELYTIENLEFQDIAKENKIVQDEHGTYFREITTDKVRFDFNEKMQKKYKLVVNFPSNYNDIKYQDVIEGIEISVDSEQITE